jgi:O-antigen biosynthesis protein
VVGKVSALVSAYYSQRFLANRIENLLDQSPVPEIVIVCQADSPEQKICEKYRITPVLTVDIPTIGGAWNKAVQFASGDYLVIANTDDIFFHHAVYMLSEVLDKNSDVGYVFGDQHLEMNGFIDRRVDHGHIGKGGKVDNIADLLRQRYFCGSAPMWRNSLHDEIGGFDESFVVATDHDWAMRCADAGVGFYYLPESVGIYPIRKDSLEHRNSELCRKESRRIRGLA